MHDPDEAAKFTCEGVSSGTTAAAAAVTSRSYTTVTECTKAPHSMNDIVERYDGVAVVSVTLTAAARETKNN